MYILFKILVPCNILNCHGCIIDNSTHLIALIELLWMQDKGICFNLSCNFLVFTILFDYQEE